jgi:hypothetical protein
MAFVGVVVFVVTAVLLGILWVALFTVGIRSARPDSVSGKGKRRPEKQNGRQFNFLLVARGLVFYLPPAAKF